MGARSGFIDGDGCCFASARAACRIAETFGRLSRAVRGPTSGRVSAQVSESRMLYGLPVSTESNRRISEGSLANAAAWCREIKHADLNSGALQCGDCGFTTNCWRLAGPFSANEE